MQKTQIDFKKSDFLKTMRAFTLVELMVVVAIIAGLLMMALPNIRKQRARARSAQCQNNLRQYGVAMHQYMAENDGYFIHPGSGGTTAQRFGVVREKKEITKDYGAKAGHATLRGSLAQSWADFIRDFIPEQQITDDFLRGSPSSARICPEVDLNVFIPSSPQFKGWSTQTDTDNQTYDVYDFRLDSSTAALDPDKYYYMSYFTTYAINLAQKGARGLTGGFAAYQQSRSNIPNHAVAFIDWNAAEGWGANITNNTWQFNGKDRNGDYVSQGTPKTIENWWQTEIGFHHPGRSNDMVANYVAIDGSVGNISSNEISLDFFR